MYNKDISEKMLEDVIDMYDNISKIKKVCGEIVSRNVIKIKDNEELGDLFDKYTYISKAERRVNALREDMIDTNGGVRGYDSSVWLLYVNAYSETIEWNIRCNKRCEEIRKKYM